MTAARSRRLLAAVLVSLLLPPGLAAARDQAGGLSGLRESLRTGNVAAAVTRADACLALGVEDADEVLYLKALALHHLGRDEASIRVTRELVRKHPESSWRRKARFLEARGLARQSRFEQAEAIYEAEANRLLSGDRKRRIAAVLIQFAEELSADPNPADPGALPPDFGKAYNLYKQTLDLQIPRDLRDTVLFRLGVTARRAQNYGAAINHFREYLDEFDPDWTGPVGSAERLHGHKRQNPPPAGAHVFDARYQLGKCQLESGDRFTARRNFRDLLTLLERPDAAGRTGPEHRTRIANTSWQVVRTHNLPVPTNGELEAGLRAAREFLDAHPAHRHAVEAAWLIAQTYMRFGRTDEAVAAYLDFLGGRRYALPEGEAAREVIGRLGRSPQELERQWRPEATFTIGRLRFDQRRFDDAIEWWQRYLNEFPNGPQWSDAQRLTVDARFRIAIDAVAGDDPDHARDLLGEFLREHPLDGRAAQVLFVLGQMHVAEAERLDDPVQARVPLRAAMTEWARLISKYPQSEPASVALYRTALIQEEKLGDLESALDSYRRLTWGSAAPLARQREAMLTRKQLTLRTPRTFRTGEAAHVSLDLRNVERLSVRQYFLDPEAYFRKRHTTGGVEDLDIALIEPDRTWDVEIDGYAKYLPLEQTIEVPFPGDRPGVCLLNVSEDDLEATTLVICSDLDVILKTSRRETLVFAQNMTTGAPAPGVGLLLSDGSRIFGTGRTGDDGVFTGRFDDLETTAGVRVFASSGGHIASNGLDLSGLGFSTGLNAKGYIYTDRPAYRPGQDVACRGVLRDVKDGVYTLPATTAWIVSVHDERGRLLHEEPVALSAFGTFDTTFPLDPAARVGRYTISARPDDKSNVTHTGDFVVETFQLPKMALEIEFERTVVFPGERVRATAIATYQWGEPVPATPLRCHLPDGRTIVRNTDDDGRVELEFDTTGLPPGRILPFHVSIEGENVNARGMVTVPLAAFSLATKPSRPLALAGEPVEVTVTATNADGTPAEEDVRLYVLHRATPPADPVLSAVPWVAPPTRSAAEVTVQEHEARTDEATGRAVFRLELPEGGRYVLRAAGTDRRGQVVTAESALEVSGDEDDTKLRIFADAATVQVGAPTTVDLHSRVPAGTALLTWEGERILGYRVLQLRPGHNPVELEIGHEHFPNFSLSIAALDDRRLRTASQPFMVERALRVELRPRQDVVAPGETGVVELIVTDQLGRPVQAELSLALVDEALLAIYPDDTPDILPFFQADARRHADFRIVATNGFEYTAQTRDVVKAVLEEASRLERAFAAEQERVDALEMLGEVRDQAVAGRRMRQSAAPAPAAPMAAEDAEEVRFAWRRGASKEAMKSAGGNIFGDPGGDGDASARRELPGVGWWTPSIVTDERGRAVVEVPMPQTTTRWRLVARGVTPQTLVGQATSEMITRKDLFVEMKVPGAVTEGDRIRTLARIHNVTGYRGPVTLTLTVGSGTRQLGRLERTVDVSAETGAEVLFEAFAVPAVGELELTLAMRAGRHRDTVIREVAVQPWGMEYADHGGGVARGNAAVSLRLPRDLPYASRWLTVYLGPSLEQAVVDLALGGHRPIVLGDGNPAGPAFRPVAGQTTASALLAAATGLGYARHADAADVDILRLERAARSFASSLAVTERESGGWGWVPGAEPDWAITAASAWALAETHRNGIAVDAGVRSRADAILRALFQQTSTADHDRKAIILHALSESDHADFELANALYRERGSLGPLALAYTALTLENLDRRPAALELVTRLESLARRNGETCAWAGGTRHYTWLNDEVPTTALALLALSRIKAESRLAEPAARFLLGKRGCFGFSGAQSRGLSVAALTSWFAIGAEAATDAKVTIVVNGKRLRTVQARATTDPMTVQVPPAMLADGQNTVRFEMDGRGRYAYAATLRGFSPELRDPRSWNYPYVQSRLYLHAPLLYRDRPIGATSSSPVRNIEIGQRVRVRVDLYNQSIDRDLVIQEPIPAGLTLVPGTLSGRFTHHELQDNMLTLYVPRSHAVGDYTYELVGTATGRYRVLPSSLRDAGDPGRMRMGEAAELNVLAPGESSDDPYRMNDAERFALGRAHFEDGRFPESLEYLWPLFDRERKYQERDVARMLLWIHTQPEHFDAARVVQAFELLSVRHPQLTIPFDKILVVGQAYRYIGEFERAWLVFRATIDSSFLADSSLAAILQDEGQLFGSIDYQAALWWEYPDTAEVSGSYLALSQLLYENADRAHLLADNTRRASQIAAPLVEKPSRAAMLGAAAKLLDRFLVLYPASPLRDDAAFSLTNAFLDLQDYKAVVGLSDTFRLQFSESEFASSFRYMEALGYFWQREYEPALAAARVVANGQSQDRDFARYILGQIHHAQGDPEKAIAWYEKVRGRYPDAAEAIDFFREKRISLDEVTIRRPGEPVDLTLKFRNIPTAHLQVYKVDLMKLYLREKNLSRIAQINLAGIEPQLVEAIELGDGRDYTDRETTAQLDLEEEGAYLVICRGDDLFASGLVLITPLEIEVQEDTTSGRVRVYLVDRATGVRPAGVHVKAIGSAEQSFHSGETDLRGLFVADGVRGEATAIARDAESRYAFYRGKTWLGAPPDATPGLGAPVQRMEKKVDYLDNLRQQNRQLQQQYNTSWDSLRRSGNKGVQIDKAR